MSDLNTIIFATIRSAKATKRMALWQHKIRDAHSYEAEAYYKSQLARARRDYTRAQKILANHPLPGDETRFAPDC